VSSFIDLSKCYLFTEMRIRRKDGNNLVDLVDGEVVAPIQMIGGTFIKNIKVTMNGREIYDSNGKVLYNIYNCLCL
jgi:hypothetical protein